MHLSVFTQTCIIKTVRHNNIAKTRTRDSTKTDGCSKACREDKQGEEHV